MALEISVVHDQVLAFNPALLLYAAAQLCRIFETPQEANPAGLPLRLHVPWRTEQHRNSRYELAPLHSISSWQLEDDGQNITSRRSWYSLRVQNCVAGAARDAGRLQVICPHTARCRIAPALSRVRILEVAAIAS